MDVGDPRQHLRPQRGVGSISFRDIADKHIGGDSDETWGVPITYAGSHMVGRYEGGGQLHVTFDEYLRATVSGMHLRLVKLDSLVEAGSLSEPAASPEQSPG